MKPRSLDIKEYKVSSGSYDWQPPSLHTSLRETFNVYTDYLGPRDLKSAHPHSFYKLVALSHKGVSLITFTNGTFGKREGVLGAPPVPVGPVEVPSEVVNQAVSRLYEKYRGGIDLSVDLYQGRQTAKLTQSIFDVVRYVRTFNVPMLFKSFTSYRAYIKKEMLYSGRFHRSIGTELTYDKRAAIKAGGGLWLAYSYGLKPSVQTVFDTLDRLQSDIEPMMKIEVNATKRTGEDITRQVGIDGLYFDAKAQVWHGQRCKIEARYKYDTSTLGEISRFSSVNPASFLWENTPFSFVVDWFVDIGGFLRNYESALLSRSVFGGGYITKTWRRTVSETATIYETGSFGGGYARTGFTQGKTTESGKDRAVLIDAPLPRSPQFKVDFSSPLRALNAVSLLTQFLGSRK